MCLNAGAFQTFFRNGDPTMTNARNQHPAIDAALREIFKTMDADRAQEIRER